MKKAYLILTLAAATSVLATPENVVNVRESIKTCGTFEEKTALIKTAEQNSLITPEEATQLLAEIA